MDFGMRDLNQEIIKFDYKKNFKDDDFYVSKSNKHIFELLNKWPKWEKNFLNINGENFSGKTHLINIFLKKFNGIKLESNSLNNNIFNEYWTTPQNIDLKKLSALYDMKYSKVDTIRKLENTLKQYKNISNIKIIDAQIDMKINKKTLSKLKKRIKKGTV